MEEIPDIGTGRIKTTMLIKALEFVLKIFLIKYFGAVFVVDASGWDQGLVVLAVF
jgi:hypothetical protein